MIDGTKLQKPRRKHFGEDTELVKTSLSLRLGIRSSTEHQRVDTFLSSLKAQ